MRRLPPWDLAELIYPVSMQVILGHTLAAPPLLPHARRLQELVRETGAAPGGFSGIRRNPELEDLLLTLDEHHGRSELTGTDLASPCAGGLRRVPS
jgi:hypothetical protein